MSALIVGFPQDAIASTELVDRSRPRLVQSLDRSTERTGQELGSSISRSPQTKLDLASVEMGSYPMAVYEFESMHLVINGDEGSEFLTVGLMDISEIDSVNHEDSSLQPTQKLSHPVIHDVDSDEKNDIELEQSTLPSRLLASTADIDTADIDHVDLNPGAELLQRPLQPSDVEIQQEVSINLRQAIELAERNNQQFQIALLRLEQSKAQLREAQAALFPSLSFQVNVNRALEASGQLAVEAQRRQLREQISSGEEQIVALQELLDRPVDQTDPVSVLLFQLDSARLQQAQSSLLQAQTSLDDAENYATLQFSGGLGVSYLIFSGERGPLIQAARHNVRSNELEITRIRQQISLDVATAYYQVQQADRQVVIEEEAVQESTRSRDTSETLTSVGMATRLDVLNSEVQLGDAVQRLIRAQSQQRTTRRQLAQLLNIAPDIEPLADDRIEIAGTWDLSLEESIAMALNNRTELEQILVEREVRLAQRRAALGALLPRVNFSANYNVLQANSDDPSEFTAEGTATGYSLGLNLQWDFFDGGAAISQSRQRQIDARIAEVNFSEQSSSIRFQVEQAYFDLEANEQNLETARQTLESAEEALRISRLRFQSGVGVQSDILDAEARLTQARENLLQAILGYNIAFATLRRSVEMPLSGQGVTLE